MSNNFAEIGRTIKTDSFIRRTLRFSFSTVISRLLGLVREQVFSHYFGAGAAVDSFNAAFRIPNLLRDFFAEGALSAAYVPVFSQKLKSEGLQKAFALTSSVFSLLLVLLGAISLIGMLLSPFLVRIIAPGFADTAGQAELTAAMTRIMFPFLLFVALAAAAMGTLNCFGRFGIPALAPAGFNLASIAAGLFFREYFDPPILVMAWGALIGGVLQLTMQMPQLFSLGFRFRFKIDLADPAVGSIVRLMGPAAIGVAAAQLNIVIGTMLASFLPEGSIAYMNYAFRLMHFPLGVFGVAVATVSLPKLSGDAAVGDRSELLKSYIRSCKIQSSMLLPSALFLIVAARPLCALIYQHGRFGWQDTVNAAAALQAYSFGLLFFGMVRLSAQVFYAFKDTATPVKVSALAVAVNVAASLILMRPLGFVGLALAPALAAQFNLGLLNFLIIRKIGRPDYPALTAHAAKCLAASLAGSAALYLILNEAGAYSGYKGISAAMQSLAPATAAFLLIYVGIGYLLKIFLRETTVR